jgi:glutaminyl-tRNA synthetase
VRLYDRLFATAQPGSDSGNFLDDLNPDSVRTLTAQLEPALRDAQRDARFQFERHGYFVADRRDSQPGAPVFNRTVTLKDSWAKSGK